MRKSNEQVDRIEKALVRAHRKQKAPDLPPEWREHVMRHIRRLYTDGREAETRPSTALVFQRAVLPFATATGLVAVALLGYMLSALPAMEQDLFSVLTQDPSGLLAMQALGL